MLYFLHNISEEQKPQGPLNLKNIYLLYVVVKIEVKKAKELSYFEKKKICFYFYINDYIMLIFNF